LAGTEARITRAQQETKANRTNIHLVKSAPQATKKRLRVFLFFGSVSFPFASQTKGKEMNITNELKNKY